MKQIPESTGYTGQCVRTDRHSEKERVAEWQSHPFMSHRRKALCLCIFILLCIDKGIPVAVFVSIVIAPCTLFLSVFVDLVGWMPQRKKPLFGTDQFSFGFDRTLLKQ